MDAAKMLESGSTSKAETEWSPLCKECVDSQEEKASKYLVPDEDGNLEVSQDHSPSVVPGIGPYICSGEKYANKIERHDSDKEFPIRVEPYSEPNP
jgi:hypothetical protein